MERLLNSTVNQAKSKALVPAAIATASCMRSIRLNLDIQARESYEAQG